MKSQRCQAENKDKMVAGGKRHALSQLFTAKRPNNHIS